MTLPERAELKAAIRFYEKRGWDWSDIVEYLAIRYNGQARVVLPKRRVNFTSVGRPRKRKDA